MVEVDDDDDDDDEYFEFGDEGDKSRTPDNMRPITSFTRGLIAKRDKTTVKIDLMHSFHLLKKSKASKINTSANIYIYNIFKTHDLLFFSQNLFRITILSLQSLVPDVV
mgnify:CR=1 FL=1